MIFNYKTKNKINNKINNLKRNNIYNNVNKAQEEGYKIYLTCDTLVCG